MQAPSIKGPPLENREKRRTLVGCTVVITAVAVVGFVALTVWAVVSGERNQYQVAASGIWSEVVADADGMADIFREREAESGSTGFTDGRAFRETAGRLAAAARDGAKVARDRHGTMSDFTVGEDEAAKRTALLGFLDSYAHYLELCAPALERRRRGGGQELEAARDRARKAAAEARRLNGFRTGLPDEVFLLPEFAEGL